MVDSWLRSRVLAVDRSSLVPALRNVAARLRIDSIRATSTAGSGHPTSCCSAADVVAALFFSEMRFDPENGGIASGQAKFPSLFPCRFLMRHYRRTNRQYNLDMVNHTLEKMAAGGIYDHIGGGFHRYRIVIYTTNL